MRGSMRHTVHEVGAVRGVDCVIRREGQAIFHSGDLLMQVDLRSGGGAEPTRRVK